MSNLRQSFNEHLPDILMGAGIVGSVGGIVLGCVATTKLPPIWEEYGNRVADIELIEDSKERKKALAKVKMWLVWQLTKNYAGTVAVEGLSIASELTAYGKVKQTCAELAVTVGVLDGALKTIRSRSNEAIGEEKTDDIWYGAKEEVVQEEKKDEEGNVVQEEKKAKVFDADLPSPYARWFCFDDFIGAELDLTYNKMFLQAQEQALETYLKAEKIIYMSELNRVLGSKKKTVADNHVGFVYDPNKPGKQVDLRIRLALRRKPDGTSEWCYMIDPNVQPVEQLALKLGYLKDF